MPAHARSCPSRELPLHAASSDGPSESTFRVEEKALLVAGCVAGLDAPADVVAREWLLCSSVARLCTRCSHPASFVSHCGFGMLRQQRERRGEQVASDGWLMPIARRAHRESIHSRKCCLDMPTAFATYRAVGRKSQWMFCVFRSTQLGSCHGGWPPHQVGYRRA